MTRVHALEEKLQELERDLAQRTAERDAAIGELRTTCQLLNQVSSRLGDLSGHLTNRASTLRPVGK